MKKIILGILLGLFIASGIWSFIYERIINNLIDENQKKQEFYDVFYKWLQKKGKMDGIPAYFIRNNYKKIAVYGMKEIGQLLCDEIMASDEVSLKYAIDTNTKINYKNVPIISPSEDLDDVDVIVVTAVHYYNEIEDCLSKKVTCPIISIEDIVYS